MSATSFVDLDNARLDEQKKVMQQIIAAGHCPFCIENLTKYHKLPILKSGQFWLVTQNQWPYHHTRHHFLMISRRHAEHLCELDPRAGEELIRFAQELEKEFHIPGGGLALRFGDTHFSAGTVKHLHAQLIQPDYNAADFQPVRFKIGKDHSSN